MVKIISEPSNGVHVSEMKDGDIAIITSWSVNRKEYRGRLVQRCGKSLISIGMPYGSVWNTIFENAVSESCRVRILPPGTVIEL